MNGLIPKMKQICINSPFRHSLQAEI